MMRGLTSGTTTTTTTGDDLRRAEESLNQKDDDEEERSSDVGGVKKGERGSTLPSARAVKRFWKSVDVKPSKAIAGEFNIALDDRVIKTPKGVPVSVPSKPLAHSLALEWVSQGTYLLPYTMPLMILTTTTIDRTNSPLRKQIIDEILSFLPTDVTLCRSDDPKWLGEKMEAKWGPVIDGVSKRMGVVFHPTFALTGSDLSPEHLQRLRNFVEGLPVWDLSAFDAMTHNLRSFILAAALYHNEITPEKAVELSRLEENIQIENWGEVEGNHDVDRLALHCSVGAAWAFKELIHPL